MTNRGYTEAGAIAALGTAIEEIDKAGIGWRTPDHGVKEMFDELKRASFLGDKVNFARHNPVRQCAFIGCAAAGDDVSINSHVLAKKSSLLPLADSLKKPVVLQPNLRSNSRNAMRTLGIGEASTFIGYCRKHEGDFAVFENDKQLKAASHYMLQLMRSAARELWRKQIYIDGIGEMVEIYEKAVDLLPSVPEEQKLGWREKFVEPLTALRVHAEIQLTRLAWIHADLTEHLDAASLPDWVNEYEYDSRLKVALSGSSFNVGDPAAPMFVMAVFPNRDKTLLLLASSKDDPLPVQRYVAKRLATPRVADDTIKAWMGHTDHWFVSPEWWNNIYPQPERDSILRQLAST